MLYARVSTGAQADRQLSIPAQLSAMREYVDRNGWTIAGEFLDAGVSGRTADRPQLLRLLEVCKAGERKADAVVVHKLDRLARNIADHVAIRAVLSKCGIRLVSVSENLDDESVSGKLIENIMASLAEFYSANLSDEVRKGLTQRVRQGGWPHMVPAGYRKGSAIGPGPRPTELDSGVATFIKAAFEAVAMGRMGVSGVARWADRHGWKITKSGVARMLRNPFYTGRLLWKGQIFPGSHPALVSGETFERVQVALRARFRAKELNPASRSLLHGIARCDACGSMVGSETHGAFRYYRCRKNMRSRDRCSAPYMVANLVHEDLARVYGSVSNNGAVHAALKAAMQARAEAWTWESQREQALRSNRLGDIHARELRLANALADGLMSAEIYRLAMQELMRERAKVEAQVPATQGDTPIPVLSAAGSILELHQSLDPDRQRMLAELIFVDLRINRGGIASYELRSEQQLAA